MILGYVVDLHKHKDHPRPQFDIYIGRATYNTEFNTDSKWHNPYRIIYEVDRRNILKDYKKYIRDKIKEDPIIYNIEELRGKILGCWCIDSGRYDEESLRCHGQILLKIISESKK